MRAVALGQEDDFDGWRDAARSLALAGVGGDEVVWSVGGAGDLFADEAPPEPAAAGAFSVPRPFVELARSVVLHADPERFALLYQALDRVRRQPGSIDDRADPLFRRLDAMARAVRRDIHKMRAFLRFRELAEPDGVPRFVAWWEPEHHIVRANAGFFVRRFAAMRWSILTPALSIHWDGETLSEGPVDAALMLVGEQPGDQEDLAGRPFVGPAGQLLDRALGEAGIDRTAVYVTNAVKHFKFEPRGRRRIHAKPGAGEIDACRWWIDQERAILRPALTVALGATAARSLLGRAVTIGRERGRPIDLPDGGRGFVTIHPSYLLRIEDKAAADDEYRRFVEELGAAKALAAG